MNGFRILMAGWAAVVFAGPALAASNLENGRALAERWCSACHVVTSDQTSATEGAPPFAEVAARRTDDEIARFLFDPHPPMAPLTLSRSDMADLVAHIAAQRPEKAE